MSLSCFRHWFLPLEFRRRREWLLLLWLWSLWICGIMIGEIVKYILLAFSFPKKLWRITILHLVLMEGSYFHFYWVFSLFFLKWTRFLLEFNLYRFRVCVRTSIRVILLFSLESSLWFLLLLPKIKAIFMTSKLFFIRRTWRLSLWLMKIEVKILPKFRWLSLPQIRLRINAACSWSIQITARKHIWRVSIKWAFSCTIPHIYRFIQPSSKQQLIATNNKIRRWLMPPEWVELLFTIFKYLLSFTIIEC